MFTRADAKFDIRTSTTSLVNGDAKQLAYPAVIKTGRFQHCSYLVPDGRFHFLKYAFESIVHQLLRHAHLLSLNHQGHHNFWLDTYPPLMASQCGADYRLNLHL